MEWWWKKKEFFYVNTKKEKIIHSLIIEKIKIIRNLKKLNLINKKKNILSTTQINIRWFWLIISLRSISLSL